MALSRVERQRLQDSRFRIQSIVSALAGLDPEKLPDREQIDECLRDAEKSIEIALNSGREHRE